MLLVLPHTRDDAPPAYGEGVGAAENTGAGATMAPCERDTMVLKTRRGERGADEGLVLQAERDGSATA